MPLMPGVPNTLKVIAFAGNARAEPNAATDIKRANLSKRLIRIALSHHKIGLQEIKFSGSCGPNRKNQPIIKLIQIKRSPGSAFHRCFAVPSRIFCKLGF
jgi:hypothetical protein